MSAKYQIEKNFIDGGKTLVNAVTTQTVGPFDNTTLAVPRTEVDFFVDEQRPDGRMLSFTVNNAAVYVPTDYRGTWQFGIVTRHTDANHSNYVGQVRKLMLESPGLIQSNTNTYYEVQGVWETGQERERDDNEDELRTALRFRVDFSIKP